MQALEAHPGVASRDFCIFVSLWSHRLENLKHWRGSLALACEVFLFWSIFHQVFYKLPHNLLTRFILWYFFDLRTLSWGEDSPHSISAPGSYAINFCAFIYFPPIAFCFPEKEPIVLIGWRHPAKLRSESLFPIKMDDWLILTIPFCP